MKHSVQKKIKSLKSPRQKIATIINLTYFFMLAKTLDKVFGYDKKAKIYFRRPLIPQKTNNQKIQRLYQLNNFLEIYESAEFREKIKKSEADVFIDIGATSEEFPTKSHHEISFPKSLHSNQIHSAKKSPKKTSPKKIEKKSSESQQE